ncbi:unnamed protein product [Calicophoron daubneyi]|uniref:Sodium/myo-inositol cotransporter n=1 Tax=Calicophoron daubneyi TaxID=300641 RepID=A0AAV2TDI5_CALDB
MSSNVKVDGWDISVLVVYFIGLLITGFVSMFASRRGTVSGYFLAGRFMTWLPIGASLFASNIGSEHFIGLAGSGAASGIGVGAFELNASLLLMLLGWVFLPVYIASGVCTLPEYMKRRYGGNRIQVYLAGLSLLLYVFTKISVNLYSGALFLQEALKWDTWLSILLILVLTAVITVTGGLAAVLYTDTLQCFVMVIGALVLSILSFIRVGGFEGLLQSYGQAIDHLDPSSERGQSVLIALANASAETNITALSGLASLPSIDPSLRCSLPSTKAFTLLREVDDPYMPWLGFILGQTPSSIWYWCADQMMVQRALAAKSLSHAQGATLFAGLLKQLPLFVIVFPGMISRVLFADEVACTPGPHCERVCGQRNGCSNLAYPKLVMEVMPSGLRGLMLSVMLAALISDLTSLFNSASTLFTVDIYRRARRRAEDRELMVVGRLFVVVLIGASIAWVPVVQMFQGSQLYIYIQAVAAYLSPPIASVYLITILWRRATEQGAFFGLVYGLLIGLIRLVLNIVYDDPVCGQEDTRPWILSKIHYTYFALFSFITTALVMMVLSLFGTPPSDEQVSRLTYWTAWDPIETQSHRVFDKQTNHTVDILDQINNNNNNAQTTQPTTTFSDISKETACQIDDGMSIDYKSTEIMASFDSAETHAGDCLRHTCLWLCGCEEHPCPPKDEKRFMDCICCCRSKSIDDKENKREELDEAKLAEVYALRLQKVVSLKQNRSTRIGLLFGVIVTILMALFGFIFFSTYFDRVIPGPIPLASFEHQVLPSNVSQAIRDLENLGVVAIN